MTDAHLIERIQHGDKTAFARLVEQMSPKAWRVAARYLKRREEVEDVVQDAFTKVWTNACDYDAKRAGFSTWFFTILTRLCIDRLRRRIASEPGSGDAAFEWMMDEAPDQEVTLARHDEARLIRSHVDSLPIKQRTAIILCYLEDMPQTEAARIMGVHIKALEGLLHRAKLNLKGGLSQAYAHGS